MPKAKLYPSRITTIYEDQVSQSVRQRYMGKINRQSLHLITNINNAMKDAIGNVLRQGIEEGSSVAAIGSKLLATGIGKGVFRSARRRAYLIARTELHRARQQAAMDVYRANNIKLVKWIAISDSRICHECASREGRVFNINSVSEDWLPPIHPRCRCRVVPSDFDISISVKRSKKGKVVETKISPSPTDYLYVVKLKKAMEILEKSNYKYSSTQVNLPSNLAKEVLALVKKVNSEDLHPTEEQEDVPHITILYGLHKNTPKPVKNLLESIGSIKASISVMDIFQPEGRDYDVLVHRIDSPELNQLNLLLRQLPYSSDFNFYQPHLTICYLKRGVGQKYVNSASGLEGTPIEFSNIIFSSKDGKKTSIELKKAKPYTRTRRGKLERVRGYPGRTRRPTYLTKEFKKPKFFSEDEWKSLLPWSKERLVRAYKSDADVFEGYTIGQHTEMVVKQFDKYFSTTPIPLLGENIFRKVLLLHDVGKAEALERDGSKKNQHEYNKKVVETILPEFEVDKIKQLRVATSIVGQDWIGDYLKGSLDSKVVAEWMLKESTELEVPVWDYFKLCKVYWVCDASAYTKDAGGKESLDYLFNFDPIFAKKERREGINLRGSADKRMENLTKYVDIQSIRQRNLKGEFVEMWHGTSYSHLVNIVSEGITSGHYRNFEENMYENVRGNVVFSAETFADAAFFARRAAEVTGEVPIILQLKIPRGWFTTNAIDDDRWSGNAVMTPGIDPSWIIKAYGMKTQEEKPESLIAKLPGGLLSNLGRIERDKLLTKEIEQDYKEVWERIKKAKNDDVLVYVPITLKLWEKFEEELDSIEKSIPVKGFTRTRHGHTERVGAYSRSGKIGYHGTTYKFLEKILSEGLRSSKETGISMYTKEKGIGLPPERSGVYFTREPERAFGIATLAAHNFGGNPVIFVAKVDPEKAEADEDFGATLAVILSDIWFEKHKLKLSAEEIREEASQLKMDPTFTTKSIFLVLDNVPDDKLEKMYNLVVGYKQTGSTTSWEKLYRLLDKELTSEESWKIFGSAAFPGKQPDKIMAAISWRMKKKEENMDDYQKSFSSLTNMLRTVHLKGVEKIPGVTVVYNSNFKKSIGGGLAFFASSTGLLKKFTKKEEDEVKKAVPVKAHLRTRKGKRERVREYQRKKHPGFFNKKGELKSKLKEEIKDLAKEERESLEGVSKETYDRWATGFRSEKERQKYLKQKKVDPEQEAALRRLFAKSLLEKFIGRPNTPEVREEIKNEVLKAIQVKGFLRTRKGKREWVKPHHRQADEIMGKIPGIKVRAGATELEGELEKERWKEQKDIVQTFLSGKFATPEAEERFLHGVEHGVVTIEKPIKGKIKAPEEEKIPKVEEISKLQEKTEIFVFGKKRFYTVDKDKIIIYDDKKKEIVRISKDQKVNYLQGIMRRPNISELQRDGLRVAIHILSNKKIPEVPPIDQEILHPDLAEKAWIKVSEEFPKVKNSIKAITDAGSQQGKLRKLYKQDDKVEDIPSGGYNIEVGSGFARHYFKEGPEKFYEVTIRHELLHAEAERLGLKETPELEKKIDELARKEYKGELEEKKPPEVEGVEYVGVQKVPEEFGGDQYLFDETKSGSTFSTKDLSKESIEEGRDRTRKKFEKGGFILDLKKSRTTLSEFRKSRVIGKLIPHKIGKKTYWAKVLDGGLVIKEPKLVKVGSEILVKSGIGEVTAVGSDGVTARDDSGRKVQILNKNIQLLVRR